MGSKRNILFVLPSAQCGGAEKVIINIANNINTSTYRATLLFVDDEGPLIDQVNNHTSIYSLKKKRVSRSLFLMLKTARNIHPDVILTSIFHLNIAVIVLKQFLHKKTKVIIRESNILSIVLLREKFPRLFAMLIRIFYPRADAVISLGSEMKDNLKSFFKVPSRKIFTIGNPIEPSYIQKLSRAYTNPLDNSVYNFLAVGSLTHQKGFDLLILAMAIVAEHHPDVHLSIIGEGILRDELQRLIQENNLDQHVTLIGYMENPYPYFLHADRFILSSRYEGLPNVVLESLALGTKVIALDNPGCLRDIITEETQGILVKPCTTDRLADEMLEACRLGPSDNKESLLPENFLIANVIKRYEALFESV